MVKLFEKRPVSDHIQIAAFPAKKDKGEVCVFGSLVGLSDYDTASGAAGSVDVGKQIAVFQAAKADLMTAAIGADVYITSAGALTTTASGSTLLGTIVAVGGDTFDIAITG